MKRNLLIILLAIIVIGFSSCEKDETPTIDYTLTMGADYENDVYYSLANGIVAEVPRTNWDIALSVNIMSSSIIINEGAGVVLKEYPTQEGWLWESAIDTTGYSTWTELYNSDENWEVGAFSQNETGAYGWGDYNPASHDIEGVAMYIIKLVSGDYKRIFIENKMAGTEYNIKYSDLDGTNEVTKKIPFAGLTSNYIYYSIENNGIVEREPDASTWDLLFTKYYSTAESYLVTGVKQNNGVLAIDMDNVQDLTIETYSSEDFDENITTIGSDWKTFDFGTNKYSIDADRMYFVKDKDENVYKIVFRAFDGSSTGNITFDITGL